jgi:hypothetical protein
MFFDVSVGVMLGTILGVQPAGAPLLEVSADGVDQLARGAGPVGIALSRGIYDVDTDVVLHDLGHEAVDGTSDGRDQLQHLRAPGLRLDGALEGLDLTPDPANPADEFRLLSNRVAHALEDNIG